MPWKYRPLPLLAALVLTASLAGTAFGMGTCQDAVGRNAYDEAITACTKSLDAGGRSAAEMADDLNNRGRAYAGKRQFDSAVRDFFQAIRLNQNDPQLYYNRGLAFAEMGQSDRAIQDFDQAIRLKPNNPEAYTIRGNLYANRGRLDMAIQDYDKAIQLKSDQQDAFVSRGNAYADKGQFDRAMQDFDQAIRLQPDDFMAFTSRGAAYKNMGRYDRALQDYDQALRLKPDYVVALNNIASLLATCPDPKYLDGGKALGYAQQVVKQGRSAFTLDTLASAYARNGQYREAAQTQEEAIALLKAKGAGTGELKEFEKPLVLYKAGKPYTQEQKP